MKKIWAVSMVKNEEDIIESFCRYTLHFCDGLLIRDDNSLDHTGGIIKQLIEEGLQIVLFETPLSGTIDYNRYQFDVFNDLARQAFEERGADWVIPLDADEFLCCPDYSDQKPRSKIWMNPLNTGSTPEPISSKDRPPIIPLSYHINSSLFSVIQRKGEWLKLF